MNFDVGDKSNPTGNLIIYCEVVGQNPVKADCKIISSNIFVSFLNIGENLPAITFPPVAYETFAGFKTHLKVIEKYDLIKIPLFQFPDHADKAQKYINQRLQEVNEIVKDYVYICAKFAKSFFKNLTEEPDEDSTDLEKLDYLEKMTLNYLADSSSSLNDEKYIDFGSLFNSFIGNKPQYPLHSLMNFVQLADSRVPKLVSLLFRQSKAIYHENYEEAKTLQPAIEELSTELNY